MSPLRPRDFAARAKLLKTTDPWLDGVPCHGLAARYGYYRNNHEHRHRTPAPDDGVWTMPKAWSSFNLATGELVTAERIDVGKPPPGKSAAPVDVWVTVRTTE